MKKAAVILCGSGFRDGSEIREAVGVLWALSSVGMQVQCYALDEAQVDVVNCLTGAAVSGEKRNQLVESARIARGEVKSLTELKASAHDFVVIPGGYGAAKNLCNFAGKGSAGTVHSEVVRVLKEFRSAGKPIGAVCIAPAVVGIAFKGEGLSLTLGAGGEASAELEKLGHRHVAKGPSEWCSDEKHKVVSTPAYMHDGAPLHDIFAGIQGMVRELMRLA